MPWIYESSTGKLLHVVDINDPGKLVGQGYSGKKGFKNDIAFDFMANTGPIPPGRYTVGMARNDPSTKGRKGLGPLVMNLTPFGHKAFNRTNFRIHGDNTTRDASHGCIILEQDVRKRIAKSNDRVLFVIRKLSK
jgi:lipoprotein-anchoring transpeptidase ErfK/SrfK